MSYTSELDDSPNSVQYDLSNGSPLDQSKFSIVHFNINSILKEGRLEELQSLCNLVNVGVLVITESRLEESIPDNLIRLQGYHEPVRRDRTGGGRHGGCLIYISEQLTFKHRKDMQSDHFEHLWVDVRVCNLTFTVTCYYRPPNDDNHALFLETSEEILIKLNNHQTDHKIITSDQNFGNIYCKNPILPPKPLDNLAPDLFANFGFNQLIDIPTRSTENTTSLIDLIFVQDEEIVSEFGTLPRIADHDGVILCLDVKRTKKKTNKKTIFDYKSADINGLQTYIKEFDFNNKIFSLNVNQQTEAYSRVLIEAFSQFVPSRTVAIKPDTPPWCNTYTRLLLRKKNRNYSLFKKASKKLSVAEQDETQEQEYITRIRNKKIKLHKNARVAANESLKANRRVKQVFYNSINNLMNNHEVSAKKKFRILTKLMNNQKYSSIPPLLENNTVIDDPTEKSNHLNNFFASKASVSFPNDQPPLLIKTPNISPVNIINTSHIEVARIIRQLKKSHSSYCGIPGKFISLISTPLSFSLSQLFNNLFEVGCFPDIWKISHVTSIYKGKGLRSDKVSYRPISLLPTLSKVCESVIHQRLLSHCVEYSIITEKQAAYIKGDSTVNQLLYIVHKIRKAWTESKCTHGVMLDVKAAFDKVWHSGLIAKLEQIGIEGKLKDLFVSYLSDRKQIVVVDGEKSGLADIKAGVPQGSRLGPLLFIIYINDVVKDLESDILIFADDCTLLYSAEDPNITASTLNRDLEKISNWAFRWKVTFNAEKSKDIIFSKKLLNNTIPIELNNTSIERVNTHKHLGVILTSNLDWTPQVQSVCLRANRKLSVLRRVHYLQRSTLDVLYKVTVRSVLDYGLMLYFNDLSQCQKKQISQVQYRAAKLTTSTVHGTSQVKLEKELGWESIQERVNNLGLTLFHKIHLNITRPLIKTCMPTRNLNNINLRSFGNYVPFPFKGVKYGNSFFPYFTKKWNMLPKDVQNKNLDDFKLYIKEEVKPKKYKHYARGDKYRCSLLTRLRVGRSQLNQHMFTVGLSDTEKCTCTCNVKETTLHFMTQCPLFTENRQILFNKIKYFIPNFENLSKNRQYEILLLGYEIDNPTLTSINTKIMIATQHFLQKSKRFST